MALKYTSTMLAKGEGFLQLSENIFDVEHCDFFRGQNFFPFQTTNEKVSLNSDLASRTNKYNSNWKKYWDLETCREKI